NIAGIAFLVVAVSAEPVPLSSGMDDAPEEEPVIAGHGMTVLLGLGDEQEHQAIGRWSSGSEIADRDGTNVSRFTSPLIEVGTRKVIDVNGIGEGCRVSTSRWRWCSWTDELRSCS